MESEYQRMMLAIENYENGKLNKRAAYKEIRAAEKSLLVVTNGESIVESIIHTVAGIARTAIREASLRKKGYGLLKY